MTKNTSIVLVAAIAGIMIAGTLAVTLPTVAFATSCDGGVGKLGQSGGTGTSGGTNYGQSPNSQSGNGKAANGGDGGSADGGQGCQSVSGSGN